MAIGSQVLALALTVLSAAGLGAMAVRRYYDGRNIRVLEARYACSREEAERLYRLARRDGFASAYREVFGDEIRVPSGVSTSRAPTGRPANEPRPR